MTWAPTDMFDWWIVAEATLTPRELQIARHVATGRTNREIAQLLGTSEQTVKNQVSVIFDKLHVRNRIELAAYIILHGLHEQS